MNKLVKYSTSYGNRWLRHVALTGATDMYVQYNNGLDCYREKL